MTFLWNSRDELVLSGHGGHKAEAVRVALGASSDWWGASLMETPPRWVNLSGGVKASSENLQSLQAEVVAALKAVGAEGQAVRFKAEGDSLYIEVEEKE